MTGPWLTWPRPPLAAQPREPVAAKAAAQRISFSDARARVIWEPRLERLRYAAISVEFEMVRRHQIPATLIWVDFEGVATATERAQSLGLAVSPIKAALGYASDWPVDTLSAEPRALLDYALLVGTPPLDASRFLLAAGEPTEVAALFGYPPCCGRAWVTDLMNGRSDPLASMLMRSGEGTRSAYAALAVFGFGPLRHAPCSASCVASLDLARQFIDLARVLNYGEEARWLDEMGDWTIDASVVNGLAELKTGVFRCSWLTDEIGASRRMQWPGRMVPEGTPRGMSNILVPNSAKKTNMTSTVKRAATQPTDATETLADLGSGFLAAGFDSAIAMRSRFSTVVWEQTAALRRARLVVHLLCGDGLLLELLAQSRPSLQLLGTEEDAAAADAARRRNGPRVPILCGSYAETLATLARLAPGGVDIAFVDPERLTAAGGEIVFAISALAKTIIVIGTDRSLRRFGSMRAIAANAGLSLLLDDHGRISAAARPSVEDLATTTNREKGGHELDFH